MMIHDFVNHWFLDAIVFFYSHNIFVLHYPYDLKSGPSKLGHVGCGGSGLDPFVLILRSGMCKQTLTYGMKK
jgi:hypothetical protein